VAGTVAARMVEPGGDGYGALLAAIGQRTRLRPEGDHHKGRCPLHDDSSPSLVVYPRDRSGRPDPHYWCFGCGARGDLIDWLRAAEGLGFAQARARVEGLENRAPSPRPDPEPPGPAWQARAERLLAWAQAQLWSPAGAPARAWLTGPRRMLDETTVRAAGIGYVTRPIEDRASLWGAGAGATRIPRGLLIPTRIWGKVWGIKTRPFSADGRPDDRPGRDKYGSIRGSVPGLLGCDEVVPGGAVVGVEGEFDRWLCWQEMARDPGAFRGVAACTKGAATHRLDRYWLWHLSPAARLVWVHDNDEAGRKAAAAHRALGIARLRCAFPPEGFKDPTEMAGKLDARWGVPLLGQWLYGLVAEG
jgi:hypothetical protein